MERPPPIIFKFLKNISSIVPVQSSNETPATFVSESLGVLRTWLPPFPGVHNLFCKRVLAEKKYSSEHIFCNVCCGGSMCCSCALYLIKRLTNLLLVWHTAFQSPEFEAFSFILPCCACMGSKNEEGSIQSRDERVTQTVQLGGLECSPYIATG